MSNWSQKRKIMQSYDTTAEMYEMRYAEEQAVKYKAALSSLDMIASIKVLDIGCGSGLLFRHIAAKSQIIVGVDISIRLLRQAKKRARRFRNTHIVLADADHLPFIKSIFDVVFAFTVLQNLPKPLETLKEAKLSARQTASIVVTGLKRITSLAFFKKLLQDASLKLVSLEDTDEMKCYIAVTVLN